MICRGWLAPSPSPVCFRVIGFTAVPILQDFKRVMRLLSPFPGLLHNRFIMRDQPRPETHYLTIEPPATKGMGIHFPWGKNRDRLRFRVARIKQNALSSSGEGL